MDEYLQSAWDARQEYTKQLHEIDRNANLEKMAIELRDEYVIDHLSKYFSWVRFLYRELRPFFKEDEMNKYDKEIKTIESEIDKLTKKNMKNLKNVMIPKKIVEKIEEFHNILNNLMFMHNLRVPVSKTPKTFDELV